MVAGAAAVGRLARGARKALKDLTVVAHLDRTEFGEYPWRIAARDDERILEDDEIRSGPSTIALGAKPSVIEPPLPKLTTSSEPRSSPSPLGGPSTTPGKFACPKSEPVPALKDCTDVAKRDTQ